MKFNNWTLEDLIKYLERLKASECFDYRCVPRCFGEIFFYNGEDKAGSLEQEDLEAWNRRSSDD